MEAGLLLTTSTTVECALFWLEVALEVKPLFTLVDALDKVAAAFLDWQASSQTVEVTVEVSSVVTSAVEEPSSGQLVMVVVLE